MIIALTKKKIMRKILIPTDFSDSAKNATNYGISLFDGEDTVFVFLNTFYLPYSSQDVPYSFNEVNRENTDALFSKERERIAARFPDMKGSLESYFEVGAIVDVADSFINQHNIDYIVMGTTGASGIKEALVGSRTSSMIKKVECPMIIVPEEARYRDPEKILFTTDRELHQKDTDIDILERIAKKHDSLVHALYVSKNGENLNIEAAFIDYELNLKLVDVRHDLDVDIHKNVVQAIENYTKKYPVDMIAMVSTKGNLFHELFHRSVTKKVAMHTEIPMLIMHTKLN